MIRSGFCCFRCLTRPRSWKTFSGPSRTEQVLNRMMSASSGRSVLTTPSAAASIVGHLVRIVLVHLAPEGADEQLFRHRRNYWGLAAANSAAEGSRSGRRCPWVELVTNLLRGLDCIRHDDEVAWAANLEARGRKQGFPLFDQQLWMGRSSSPALESSESYGQGNDCRLLRIRLRRCGRHLGNSIHHAVLMAAAMAAGIGMPGL